MGKPRTPTSSHLLLPAAVQSTSAINTSEEPSNSDISLSQSGFIFLQWPHHGAKNLTNTVLPLVAPSHDSFVSSVALARPRTARRAAGRSIATVAVRVSEVGLAEVLGVRAKTSPQQQDGSFSGMLKYGISLLRVGLRVDHLGRFRGSACEVPRALRGMRGFRV